MRGRFNSVAAGALATAALLAASQADAACHLAKYFDVPVTMEGERALVTAKVNGIESRFVVDTGAFFSMINADAAKRLKLEEIPMPGLALRGIGGDAQASAGEAREFTFAGVPLKHVQFVVYGREFAPGTVGLLGENVISFADVEFDFASGMMRYFQARDCHSANLGYWVQGGTDSIAIEPMIGGDNAIAGKVKINGQWVRAVFDTGAPTSMLSLSAAARAGVKPSGEGVTEAGLARGIGKGVVESWTAPISSFMIGAEEIKNTRLEIGKLDLGDGAEMLLGMDFFLAHHVLVSRSQDKLYFSYNGGPVFRLDAPPAPEKTADKASDKAADKTAASDKAAAPDADALARQGDALMSRRDYKGALALFDRAVELEPKEAKRYVERARARRALGETDRALADFGRAIELKPNDALVLLERGSLYLSKDELDKAAQDFDAALKAAPEDGDMHLRIAQAYEGRSRHAEAIPHYDAWIAKHQHDDELWEALNGRCWARAMLGKELDKALDDCNAALRKGPRNSQVLDSRGMVHLRLGQLREAIEDYDTALKLQPKLPWSLYGRGLAKQRLGMKAEGDADIAAAVALEADLPELAERIGLIEAKAKPVKTEAKTEPSKSEPAKPAAGQPKA